MQSASSAAEAGAPLIRGARPAQPALRFWPEGRRRSGWFVIRPFALGAAALALWPTMDPALIEPPAFLSTDPERISAQFTRCGRGRGRACVVDGDTLKLGDRKVRIIGIDAPEVRGACPEETRLAEAAMSRLQDLLNQGPFEMVGRADDMQDRYGRDLRIVRRKLAGGNYQSIAEEMRKSGLAHRYVTVKTGWC